MDEIRDFGDMPKNLVELLQKLHSEGIPRNRYSWYVDCFLDFKARKYGIPFSGMFELTPLCNLDCKMCYVHLTKDQMKGYCLLTTGQWKDIMQQAHAAGMQRARLTGGECLMYPGFDDIYLFLQDMGVRISVLSNGLLLNRERIDFFKKNPLKSIQVTLYGSNDEYYERVTGRKCFEQIYENLMHAKEAQLPVTIAITPSQYSYEDRYALLSLVEKMDIPYNINITLQPPRENTGRKIEDLSIEQYVELYKLRAGLKKKNLLPVDPTELPDPHTGGIEHRGIRCAAGRSNFHVTWDGKLSPCGNLDEYNIDLNTHTFEEAWKDINKIAESFLIPRECIGCSYEKICRTCVAEHKIIPGHCNRDICKATELFVREGLIKLS